MENFHYQKTDRVILIVVQRTVVAETNIVNNTVVLFGNIISPVIVPEIAVQFLKHFYKISLTQKKNQDAMWTVCSVRCGVKYPELYRTTRDADKPYRIQCNPKTGKTKI